jgi:hypothetical protein
MKLFSQDWLRLRLVLVTSETDMMINEHVYSIVFTEVKLCLCFRLYVNTVCCRTLEVYWFITDICIWEAADSNISLKIRVQISGQVMG